MLQLTADAKYADVIELALYNSVLSGINLEGNKFCYNNPLNVSVDLPFKQRWGSEREGYIALSNCCAPNVTRTVAEVSNYAYSLTKEGLYVNLYGTNALNSKTEEAAPIQLHQQSNYPWDGAIAITFDKAPKGDYALFLRIPGWSNGAVVKVNDKVVDANSISGSYLKINRQWKKGDVISLDIPMPVQLMEANPLVEETKNQLAVKRGPLVYCLESNGISKEASINDVVLDINSNFKTETIKVDNRDLVAIKAQGFLNSESWDKKLYQPIQKSKTEVSLQLVPYFSWGNANSKEMTVWFSH